MSETASLDPRIIADTSFWLALANSRDRHHGAAQHTLAGSRGGFQIFALEPNHLSRIAEAIEKYRDLPMDLADASLVILAEHLGTGRILSTDTRTFAPIVGRTESRSETCCSLDGSLRQS